MLLAVFVVVSTLVTPQPKSQPHSQTPPARTLPSPGIAPQPSTPPPLCQTPGEVPPDGSVCGCPWGVGQPNPENPSGACLCPPEGPTPPPCTGALRPPLPKPDEALAARSNGLPEQWNSDVAVPGSRSPALRRLRKIQMLTDQPAGILRVDLQYLPDQRT
jgi:hypothetical protein